MRDNQTLKERLAPLSGKQKIEYLWTYYKWVLLVVLLAAVLLTWAVQAIVEANTELLLAGVTMNVELNDRGRQFLEQDMLTKFGTEGARQKVTLEEMLLPDTQKGNPQELYAWMTKMAGQVSSQMVDYALMDQAAYDFYKHQGMFADLTTVLTDSQIEALTPYFVYSEATAEAPSVPVAIDVTHLRFFQENAQETVVYFAMPANTERTDRTLAMLDALLAW